jgi:hypothetical protein
LATNDTAKAQVTLPKAVCEAEKMAVPARAEGGLITEAAKTAGTYMSRLEDMSRRRPIRGFSTEEIMRMTRGED